MSGASSQPDKANILISVVGKREFIMLETPFNQIINGNIQIDSRCSEPSGINSLIKPTFVILIILLEIPDYIYIVD